MSWKMEKELVFESLSSKKHKATSSEEDGIASTERKWWAELKRAVFPGLGGQRPMGFSGRWST